MIALGDRDAAAALYPALLPLRDAPPACGGLSLAVRPLAHTLGELAVFLDKTSEAAAHFARGCHRRTLECEGVGGRCPRRRRGPAGHGA